MAWLLNTGNAAEYAHVLNQMEVDLSHVLELGFGGGVGLHQLLSRGATVTGVEPSAEMRVRAFRKFAEPLADERLHIRAGRAEALPDGPFDQALSLNTVYFWEDVDAGMSELRRVVRQTVWLGVASTDHLRQMRFHESGFRVEPPEFYAERLQEAGFEVRVQASTGPSSLVIGRTRA